MMLDQMFTAKNFRKIFDRENRKGNNLATRYFPNLEPYTLAVRRTVQEIKDLRSRRETLGTQAFDDILSGLKSRLAEEKNQKSNAIDAELEEISRIASQTGFAITLTQSLSPHGKTVYHTKDEPATYFVAKQLQNNLHRLYQVKQSNRHDLVCQIRDTVRSKFPFHLVRTDISSFYETIDRKELLDKLDEDQLLSASSKKYIGQILNSYAQLTQESKGIPRGIGISAYLSELFMRPIDQKIRSLSGTVLYCR